MKRLAVAALTLLSVAGARPRWNVGMVVDQSGSMTRHDPSRIAVLAPAILADLCGSGDEVFVVPQTDAIPPTMAPFGIAGGDKRAFRRMLDNLSVNAGGSQYSHPLETAVEQLLRNHDASKRSTAILVYDGDEPEGSASIARDKLAASGVRGFVLGMGSDSAAGVPMRAFGADATRVDSPSQLIAAYAKVFAHLVGAQSVPYGHGKARGFQVDVPAGTTESWLVAIAKGDVSAIEVTKGQGTARASTPPNTGWAISDVSGGRIGYQVLRLERPDGGPWTFAARTSAAKVDWMLVPIFDVEIAIDVNRPLVAGRESPLTVTLKGAVPREAKVSARVDGQAVPLACNAAGVCTGKVRVSTSGAHRVDVHAEGGGVEADKSETIEAGDASASEHLSCRSLEGSVWPLGKTSLKITNEGGQPGRWTKAWLVVDGKEFQLSGEVGAPEWTGEIELSSLGKKTIRAFDVVDGKQGTCTAEIEVLPTVSLRPVFVQPGPIDLGNCEGAASEEAATCAACSGGCTGRVVTLDLTNSGAPMTLDGKLLLAGLPSGVTAWVGETELTKRNGPVVKVGPGAPTVDVRLCANACPSTPKDAALTVAVEVERVFDADAKEGKPRTARGTAPIGLVPHRGGFWACWGATLKRLFVAATALGILIFWKSRLRFPRQGGGQGNFPTRWAWLKSSTFDRNKLGTEWTYTKQQRRRRVFPVNIFVDDALDVTDDNGRGKPGRSAVCVELLRQERLPKGERSAKAKRAQMAWISGSSLEVAADSALRPKFKAVPPEGERLQLGTVYRVGNAYFLFEK